MSGDVFCAYSLGGGVFGIFSRVCSKDLEDFIGKTQKSSRLTSLVVFPVQNAPRLAESTNGPSSWATISKWIIHCSTNHLACCESRDLTWKPTRLVDVNEYEKGYVRVIESSTEGQALIEPYLALSHCWGREPFLVMNTSNRREFEKGVLVSSLPLNFQDAILTTRRLGFRYIWIDSLCIIQRSRKDWEREAPLMNQVYRNAFLTLGAMASPDAHGGLFRSRDPRMASPLPVIIHTERYGEVECLLIKSDFWHSHVRQAPMSQRGWVVQERILSPRSLYFCESQLFWECREQNACEWFPLGIPHRFVTEIKEPDADKIFSVKGFEKSVMRLCDAKSAGDAPQQYDTVYQVWADVLESYVRCALTNPNDKFVAISGVVKDFAKIIDDEYMAGLWRGNFVNGLLWTAMAEDDDEWNVSPAIRPDRYRAPSWSWASLDAPSMKAYHHWESQLFGDYVEVSDVHIEPKGKDPTGELRHACLHLSGPLIKLRRRQPEYFNDFEHFGRFIPDTKVTSGDHFFCLPLREEPDRDGSSLRGLVLTPCLEYEKENMTFCSKCSGKLVLRRVGTFVADQGEPLRYLTMRKPDDWESWGEESDHLWFPEDADIWNIIIV